MAVSATVTAGKIFSSDEVVTISELNKLGTPTVDISGAVGSLSLADGSVTNAKIQAATGIQYDKLETLATGELVVGNAGTATATTLSGDATIAAGGAITIANDAVTTVKVLDANITTAKLADSTGASDGVTAAKLATGAVTGPKIAMTSDAQGDILYRGASNYERLGAGTAGQVLESGGADANPSWVDSGPKGIETFESDGTFTVPAKVTSVKVTVVGGGGAGYRDGNSGGTKGCGGGGGTAIKVVTGLTPAATVAVTVGAAGICSAGGSGVGSAGGDSSFGSHCSATGGAAASGATVGGAGGGGSGGDIDLSGKSGHSGGGGGGDSYFGGGGVPVSGGHATLNNATAYGGGGMAAYETDNSPLAYDGVVIVEY